MKIEQLKLKDPYTNKLYDVALRKSTYLSNKNLYVGLVCKTKFGYEPYSDLTVNFDGELPKNQAYIDTNNNGFEIVHWLVENKLGKFLDDFAYSGFCAYPLFEFDMEKLDKYLMR